MSGLAPPREWDASGIADVPELGSHLTELEFAVLPGGAVVGEVPPAAVPALTRDLGLETPYRVLAVRRAGETWAVGAVAIEVVELPADTDGEELMLTVNEQGERELIVDGKPSVIGVESLAALAKRPHDAFVLRARRLRGTLWELTIDPL